MGLWVEVEVYKKDQMFFSRMAYPYWLTFHCDGAPSVSSEIWTTLSQELTLHLVSACCHKALLLATMPDAPDRPVALCVGCMQTYPGLGALGEASEAHATGGSLERFLTGLFEFQGLSLFDATLVSARLNAYMNEDYRIYRSSSESRLVFDDAFWLDKCEVWNTDINEILTA